MRFASPEWFLLFPVLIVLAFKLPSLKLGRPLRALLLGIAVFALLDPSIRLLSEALDVWALVDRSASAKFSVGGHLAEWESLLKSGARSTDRLRIIDFADVAVDRGEGDATYFDLPKEETRTGLAIRHAVSQFSPERNNRILLLSDGFSTEPLSGVAELLNRSGSALDYRLPPEGIEHDVQLDELRLPSAVQPGEKFVIQALVSGTAEGDIPLKLFRDGALLFDGSVRVHGGVGEVKLADKLANDARAYHYEARINPANDRFEGNNTADAWTEIHGPKQVLVISTYPDDPIPVLLRGKGIDARLVSDPSVLNVGLLGGASAVVLNNVAAQHIPRDFLKALNFYVTEQGGGLLMTGGRNSFGAGGYFESDIDKLLPVSMELKEEEHRISTAMALVLDRSGSMAASVEGNSGSMRKIDLADEGAARTISLLGSKDRLAIFAVDSEAHPIVPLTEIEGNQGSMMSKARSIDSAGGGIYVYTGLKEAWKEIEKEKIQRHIVLFADAADAEEEGEYKKLLEQITKTKSTVSVIGLGRESDKDAEFLKDVAKRGNGRIFFVSNAMDLPAVFAQETVSVARSTFVAEPTGVMPTEDWRQISSFQAHWLAAVDGYNLNYLRPQAKAVLLGKDEYKSPLVAVWQRGIGRAAAVSFPIAGEYSQRARAWDEYGEFIHTMVHWLRGPELPVGVQVRTHVSGRTLLTDFYYDNSWEERVSTSPPRLRLSTVDSVEPEEVHWQRVSPGHFQASTRLVSNAPVAGVVQLGEYGLPFGPVSLGRGPEWSFDRRKLQELDEVARQSGGGERVNLADVWNVPRNARDLRLRPILLITFLCLFLLEALLSRLNKQLRVSWSGWSELFASKSIRPAKPEERPQNAPAIKPEAPDPSVVPSESSSEKRKNLFEKAKRGGL
ncbi:MAG: VWA domain-containing protein [Bdellovibrionota bacterium]